MCHILGKGTWSSQLSETAPALPSRIFRARVSQADCGQGQLAIWFSPFTAADCSHLRELWTTASVRDHDSSRHFPLSPTHFLKEMIQSKLPGLAICFLMLTVRKTQVKDFNSAFLVTSSQPRVDLVLAVPYFAFRPLGKVSEQTPVQQDVSPPEPHEGSSRNMPSY